MRRAIPLMTAAIVIAMQAADCGAADPGSARSAVTLSLPAGFRPVAAAVLDVDGDGRPDIYLANGAGPGDALALNGADGIWRVIPVDVARGTTRAIIVADLNRDGRDDLILSGDGGVTLAINDGHNGFQFLPLTAPQPADAGVAWSVAVADLNGDGWPDLVVGRNGGSPGDATAVWLNKAGLDANAHPQFEPQPGISGCCDITDLALADLDGNGAPDLIVMHAGGSPSVLLNDGTGRLYEEPALLPAGRWRRVAAADFDNDLRPDLFLYAAPVTNGGQDAPVLLHNEGKLRFLDVTATAGLRLPETPVRAEWYDFDNDGRLDLVTVASGLRVAYQRRPGKFDEPSLPDGIGSAVGGPLAIADLNRDGFADVVARAADDSLQVVMTPPGGNRWLGFDLKGYQNGSTFGSILAAVRRDGSNVNRRQTAAGPVTLGLGHMTQIDLIMVYWANGMITRAGTDAVDTYMTLEEPAYQPTPVVDTGRTPLFSPLARRRECR